MLAYHSVDDPATFARQLDHLAAHTHPVSLGDVGTAALHGAALPARPVLITFDDADRSLVEHAVPLLGARGIPAAAFVVAGLVGTDEPFWWDEVAVLVDRGLHPSVCPSGTAAEVVRALKQVSDPERRGALDELRAAAGGPVSAPGRQLSADDVRTLAAGGIAIGSHSYTHPCLDRCGDDTLTTELARSREVLGEILGEPPAALAYPNGNYDTRVVDAAKQAGYTLGFLFDHMVGPLVPLDAMAISRVRANATTDPDRFATIVSGLHPAIHHARGRD